MAIEVSPLDAAPERLARYTGEPTAKGCREWLGHRDKNGYGAIRVGAGRRLKAHVFALMLATGITPPLGVVARHRCDNPPCVNPAHLEWGSPWDNARDRVVRGRSARLAGQTNPAAKLTTVAVEEIRALLASGQSHSSIARRHGVSRRAISKIAAGITWRNLS